MKKLSLEYLIRPPKKVTESSKLLLLFHGYGSNEADLFSFAEELPDEMLIISARAPQSLGYGSFAWYTIYLESSEGKFSDIPEAIDARDKMAGFIDEVQNEFNIAPKDTFLLGFSQGTVLSYAVALNYPEKVRYIIALSGYINRDMLPKELAEKSYEHLDFYISHGSVDQVIPFEWAKKAPEFLSQLNIANCFTEYPEGHGVASQNFYDFKNWIDKRL